MPVRYDIAAQIPQYSGGGMDPMNMMVQLQGMDYRQRQNALADIQLAQAQREMQQEQALAGLFGRQGFNPLTQQGLAEIARVNPAYFRQYVTPYAGFQAEKARETAIYGGEARAKELQPYAVRKAQYELAGERAKYPGVVAEAREKTGKAVEEDIKSAQRVLATAYMARTPEAFEARYAQVYNDLPDSIRKRLGARPTMDDVEALMATPETIAEARKPMVKKPGEVIIQGTGREGDFVETEPRYMPNAMAPVSPTNAFVDRGRMQPIVNDMNTPPVDPIIAKALRKDEMLKQLPPGPARETAGARLDLRDTLDEVSSGLTGLAKAGGIPQAGATNEANWKAAFKKSPTGQALGSLSDSEVNAQLAALRTTSAVLKAQLRKGLEMGITQMDAVKEAEKLDAAFLNPDKIKGLSEGYASVESLRRLLGGGQAAAPATRGKAGEAPAGDDLDAILGIKR